MSSLRITRWPSTLRHYLGALLRDHFSLRLALLNACEGARTSRVDPFAGVAQHLVQQGIPAVIAMQFEITDQAAITLAHEFYSALADNYGVDAALAEARKALYAAGNDIEWGTPVLYMRAQSGQLFALAMDQAIPLIQLSPAVNPTPQPPSLTDLRQQKNKKAVLATVNQMLPEFDWVTIPAGEFWMGSQKAKKPGFFARLFGPTTSGQAVSAMPVDSNADDAELPQHRLHLRAYRIARTPVTNAQFQPFVAANGYTTRAFWSTTGWQWRTQHDINEPRYWQDETWNGEDQPVVGVSWYEALAYSQWLAQLTGAAIRLPTEAQWEKAARGTGGQLYPWGNQPPDSYLCNFNNQVGKTTPVDAYPRGASPYGVLDMAGNVWEWTVTKWLENYANYATLVNNSPEGDASVRRVVRGGAWLYDQDSVRTAFRIRGLPDHKDNDLGFRVVLVVASR